MAAVDLVLKETLRHLHATVLLKQVEQAGDIISARSPELLSLLRGKGASAVLYPDPPLGSEELALLSETDLDVCPGKVVADAVEASPFPADQSPEHRYCWARGMTNMREAQVAKDSAIAARIILGGKFGPPETGPGSGEKWYAGRIPGVLEEVVPSAQAGQPVFLIGAFGGAAALAIDLLEGRDRPEATWDYQRRAPNAVAMRALRPVRPDLV